MATNDRIEHYRKQPNFVPIAEVEDGQLYWFGAVKADGTIVQFPGIVVTINGNKGALSHTSINWLEDDRVFGAFRQSQYNQVKRIAKMYEYLGNHEKATQMQLEAFYKLTPEQHKGRWHALQRIGAYR